MNTILIHIHKPVKRAALLLLLTSVVLQAGCNTLRTTTGTSATTHIGVQVVAAGLVRGDGSHSGPVYNNLKISSKNAGELLLAFDGYNPPAPDNAVQYIVKVTPINSSSRASLLAVYFIEYTADGIRLNVRRGNANLSVADLQLAQFMVEVSVIQ